MCGHSDAGGQPTNQIPRTRMTSQPDFIRSSRQLFHDIPSNKCLFSFFFFLYTYILHSPINYHYLPHISRF